MSEERTPIQIYKDIIGTASIPDWVVPKKEREAAASLAMRVEEANEWVRQSLDAKIERLDASMQEVEDNERARRLDYGAVATAADRIEGAAKELRAKIEAWTTTLMLSTATTAGRAEREAKRVAKQAREAIAGLDLARLLEREADGEKTTIGSVAPPKGEAAIRITTSLRRTVQIADPDKVPRSFCQPDMKKIAEHMKSAGEQDLIPGVEMVPEARVSVLANSGKVT